MAETIDGTVIVPAAFQAAKDQADLIRACIGDIADGLDAWGSALIAAYERKHWEILEYDSWESYCEAEFGDSVARLRGVYLETWVIRLREEAHMSERAIAAATGISQPTVHRKLTAGDSNESPETVTGTDGVTQPARKRRARPEGNQKAPSVPEPQCQHDKTEYMLALLIKCSECGALTGAPTDYSELAVSDWVTAFTRTLGKEQAKIIGDALVRAAE